SDPGDAWLALEVQHHLGVLARTPSVRLAVVSGRDLGDVTQRVAVPGAVYAGCHGLDIDGPGIAFSHPQAIAQQPMVRASASLWPGVPRPSRGCRSRPSASGSPCITAT